jgi:hypothetical protein
MPLTTNLIDEWYFENNLNNNIGGRNPLLEISVYPEGMMFAAFDMFIKAPNDHSVSSGIEDARMNLYLQNTDPTNPIPSSTMNMFVNSFYDIARNNLPGYIMGAGTSSNSNPIRSRGYIPGTGNMNMFIHNTETGYANNNTSLFITGPFPTTVTSGVPLYISGGYDKSTGEITFWTSGIATEQSGTDLFIAGY